MLNLYCVKLCKRSIKNITSATIALLPFMKLANVAAIVAETQQVLF